MSTRGAWLGACVLGTVAAVGAVGGPVAAQPGPVTSPDAATATPLAGKPAAHPGKQRPDKLKQAAREAFELATAADAAGKLPEAIRQYKRALDISPHPNTNYNLADALRRSGALDEAMQQYAEYLARSPDAPDRGAVEAMIDQLQRTPALVTIESREPHGKVFVDGEPVGDAPATLEMPAGAHQLDVITPITYGHDVCSVQPGARRRCVVNAKPRVDGNVVVSGSVRLGGIRWKVNDVQFEMKGRFDAPVGNYPLWILSKQEQCEPLWVVVQKTDDIQYFYIDAPPSQSGPGPHECHKLTSGYRQVHFAE